ncbi:DUF443 family protein [Staphylococcus petrasii]|uniref:DUF443 family protein n=1 Tax=Staphylococcus petrasii TaxID=1276936 RepID=A0ABY2KVM7_9STAP|nr:DUF443 family protein [Staphylococcus petrasii]TGE17688.1 DUF443 family protein [Staphylococcus petrasii]
MLEARGMGLHKRLKYRIINCNGRNYLVDLTNNWLTYVLPMLNWYIPKKCRELTDEEIDELGLYRGKNNGGAIWSTVGTGVLLSSFVRSIEHYFDTNISDFFNIIICLVYAILVIIFHIYIYNKKKIKHINFSNSTGKIIIIPRIKFQLVMILWYLMCGFFTFASVDLLIDYHVRNILLYLSYFLMLFMFSITNMLTIPEQKVYVKFLKKY